MVARIFFLVNLIRFIGPRWWGKNCTVLFEELSRLSREIWGAVESTWGIFHDKYRFTNNFQRKESRYTRVWNNVVFNIFFLIIIFRSSILKGSVRSSVLSIQSSIFFFFFESESIDALLNLSNISIKYNSATIGYKLRWERSTMSESPCERSDGTRQHSPVLLQREKPKRRIVWNVTDTTPWREDEMIWARSMARTRKWNRIPPWLGDHVEPCQVNISSRSWWLQTRRWWGTTAKVCSATFWAWWAR